MHVSHNLEGVLVVVPATTAAQGYHGYECKLIEPGYTWAVYSVMICRSDPVPFASCASLKGPVVGEIGTSARIQADMCAHAVHTRATGSCLSAVKSLVYSVEI